MDLSRFRQKCGLLTTAPFMLFARVDLGTPRLPTRISQLAARPARTNLPALGRPTNAAFSNLTCLAFVVSVTAMTQPYLTHAAMPDRAIRCIRAALLTLRASPAAIRWPFPVRNRDGGVRRPSVCEIAICYAYAPFTSRRTKGRLLWSCSLCRLRAAGLQRPIGLQVTKVVAPGPIHEAQFTRTGTWSCSALAAAMR
jgi:hypothetical protein